MPDKPPESTTVPPCHGCGNPEWRCTCPWTAKDGTSRSQTTERTKRQWASMRDFWPDQNLAEIGSRVTRDISPRDCRIIWRAMIAALRSDPADANEIEVTEEMVEAGRSAFFDAADSYLWDYGELRSHIVVQVYRAMESVRAKAT